MLAIKVQLEVVIKIMHTVLKTGKLDESVRQNLENVAKSSPKIHACYQVLNESLKSGVQCIAAKSFVKAFDEMWENKDDKLPERLDKFLGEHRNLIPFLRRNLQSDCVCDLLGEDINKLKFTSDETWKEYGKFLFRVRRYLLRRKRDPARATDSEDSQTTEEIEESKDTGLLDREEGKYADAIIERLRRFQSNDSEDRRNSEDLSELQALVDNSKSVLSYLHKATEGKWNSMACDERHALCEWLFLNLQSMNDSVKHILQSDDSFDSDESAQVELVSRLFSDIKGGFDRVLEMTDSLLRDLYPDMHQVCYEAKRNETDGSEATSAKYAASESSRLSGARKPLPIIMSDFLERMDSAQQALFSRLSATFNNTVPRETDRPHDNSQSTAAEESVNGTSNVSGETISSESDGSEDSSETTAEEESANGTSDGSDETRSSESDGSEDSSESDAEEESANGTSDGSDETRSSESNGSENNSETTAEDSHTVPRETDRPHDNSQSTAAEESVNGTSDVPEETRSSKPDGSEDNSEKTAARESIPGPFGARNEGLHSMLLSLEYSVKCVLSWLECNVPEGSSGGKDLPEKLEEGMKDKGSARSQLSPSQTGKSNHQEEKNNRMSIQNRMASHVLLQLLQKMNYLIDCALASLSKSSTSGANKAFSRLSGEVPVLLTTIKDCVCRVLSLFLPEEADIPLPIGEFVPNALNGLLEYVHRMQLCIQGLASTKVDPDMKALMVLLEKTISNIDHALPQCGTDNLLRTHGEVEQGKSSLHVSDTDKAKLVRTLLSHCREMKVCVGSLCAEPMILVLCEMKSLNENVLASFQDQICASTTEDRRSVSDVLRTYFQAISAGIGPILASWTRKPHGGSGSRDAGESARANQIPSADIETLRQTLQKMIENTQDMLPSLLNLTVDQSSNELNQAALSSATSTVTTPTCWLWLELLHLLEMRAWLQYVLKEVVRIQSQGLSVDLATSDLAGSDMETVMKLFKILKWAQFYPAVKQSNRTEAQPGHNVDE